MQSLFAPSVNSVTVNKHKWLHTSIFYGCFLNINTFTINWTAQPRFVWSITDKNGICWYRMVSIVTSILRCCKGCIWRSCGL